METYFVTIRYLRKEATFGYKSIRVKEATFGCKYTRVKELELFKYKIRERLCFIYSVSKIQQTEEYFFRIWAKMITREAIINIPQGVVNT